MLNSLYKGIKARQDLKSGFTNAVIEKTVSVALNMNISESDVLCWKQATKRDLYESTKELRK